MNDIQEGGNLLNLVYDHRIVVRITLYDLGKPLGSGRKHTKLVRLQQINNKCI